MMESGADDGKTRSKGAGDADAFRTSVQLAAKRFKSSWGELGRALARVRDQALWEDWGFPSFEAYCLSELRIRKKTAEKLTRSFGFLARHEPERVERDDFGRSAPPFEVIEVLAQAEDRGQLTPSEYRSVRDTIWNPEVGVADLKRSVVERFPPPPPDPRSEREELQRVSALARRLAGELRSSKLVPATLSERALELARALEELLQEQRAAA